MMLLRTILKPLQLQDHLEKIAMDAILEPMELLIQLFPSSNTSTFLSHELNMSQSLFIKQLNILSDI